MSDPSPGMEQLALQLVLDGLPVTSVSMVDATTGLISFMLPSGAGLDLEISDPPFPVPQEVRADAQQRLRLALAGFETDFGRGFSPRGALIANPGFRPDGWV